MKTKQTALAHTARAHMLLIKTIYIYNRSNFQILFLSFFTIQKVSENEIKVVNSFWDNFWMKKQNVIFNSYIKSIHCCYATSCYIM